MTQKYFYYTKSNSGNSAIYKIELERAIAIHHDYFKSAKATMGALKCAEDYKVKANSNFYRNLKRHSQEIPSTYYQINYDCIYNFQLSEPDGFTEWVDMYTNTKLPNYPEDKWNDLTNHSNKIQYERKPTFQTVYNQLAKIICEIDHSEEETIAIRFSIAEEILTAINEVLPTPQLQQAMEYSRTHTSHQWDNFQLIGLHKEHYLNRVVCEMLNLMGHERNYYWTNNWEETLQAVDIFNYTIFDRIYEKATGKAAPEFVAKRAHRDIVVGISSR